MDHVTIHENKKPGYGFIPEQFLPPGCDEYYLRNMQSPGKEGGWRHLSTAEIGLLVKNGNTSGNWDDIYVTDDFSPEQVRNSDFCGMVRIGRLRPDILEHHDYFIPAGITNSRIIACDIGDDVAIHNVRYLAHYIIGRRCMLLNIDEMHTTSYAKFGNGILKKGEGENIRIWLDLVNETGSRQVIPFDGMTTADAYLWAKYRDDAALQEQCKKITQAVFDTRRGFYGTVGDQTVIKNCRILKDAKVGSHCYIKGANKLKNITINSTADEPAQIGEGVELVNGIVGPGCHIFYGCKAVRFILGNNSNLKYGARLINSFLGDNSTISCCEVLNSLIFPAHEQHHNNSFLIASVVMGQSNLAAGATIGSNHNSRANDNEIQAGRGFWPGLCTSVKHSSRFASFVLLSKGDYPAELDIPLPFSLLNNNTSKDRLEVLPAFFWLYNMYALARNTWKYGNRDKRKTITQHIEYDSLAPDTAEEIWKARIILQKWVACAFLKSRGESTEQKPDSELEKLGRQLLEKNDPGLNSLEVKGEGMEKTKRDTVILKWREGYHAYGDMLHYYALRNIIAYLDQHTDAGLEEMTEALSGKRQTHWINLGGQLVTENDLDRLRKDIGTGKLASWDDIHAQYHELWKAYPSEKQKHAFAVLKDLLGIDVINKEMMAAALDRAMAIQEYVRDQVYISRKKDHDNPFRKATYRNESEMTAAIGTIEDNSFVKQIRKETDEFRNKVAGIKKRL